MSYYPVSELNMTACHIGDKEAEMLAKNYHDTNSIGSLLEVLDLSHNRFTILGLVHIMKIVKIS